MDQTIYEILPTTNPVSNEVLQKQNAEASLSFHERRFCLNRDIKKGEILFIESRPIPVARRYHFSPSADTYI